MSQLPVRQYRLTLRLDADSKEDLVRALENFIGDIERDEISTGQWGGVSNGAIYELLHDPAMTHHLYFAELHKYLDAKRASDPIV